MRYGICLNWINLKGLIVTVHNLYKILQELDSAQIHYHLGRYRDDVVTIHVTVPGQRIEIDVESDGEVSTAMFSGDESLELGIDVIGNIISKYG